MPVKLIEAGLVYISRAGGLSALQESGELVHSSSAAGPAAGPSGRGGGAGETKGNDTVVHVGDPGRSCCGMADPLLAATLIGKPFATKFRYHFSGEPDTVTQKQCCACLHMQYIGMTPSASPHIGADIAVSKPQLAMFVP